jgi:hypothetical protein
MVEKFRLTKKRYSIYLLHFKNQLDSTSSPFAAVTIIDAGGDERQTVLSFALRVFPKGCLSQRDTFGAARVMSFGL